MPARKYYCDYCDKQFQDTPSDRKRHLRGIQHQQAKARWYDSFKFQQQQQHPIIPPPPKPFCFHFLNTGFCRYADSCKYFHPNANNNIQQQPIITSTPGQGNVVGDSMGMGMGMSWGNFPHRCSLRLRVDIPTFPLLTGARFVIVAMPHIPL